MFKQIFLNLPVENLVRSVEFFTALGFEFDPKLTDDKSTCMLLGQDMFAMLVERSKFESFVPKTIAPKDTVEAILSFACQSPQQVRELAEKAFAAGAAKINDPEDHGFMFSWGFEDLDGHLWDLFWMNPEHVQAD